MGSRCDGRSTRPYSGIGQARYTHTCVEQVRPSQPPIIVASITVPKRYLEHKLPELNILDLDNTQESAFRRVPRLVLQD
jgi:hypothetical protein